ncbi:archaellin/type IV pilin N-terminal domain-containing protein [Nitrosopumilus adriaticus]|uniref:Flagellin n=1 Tax=Nitrosopumilus adriaticus TaxID=1580092 RepID=A0A0D5C143_9ARCH|nr:archaellin/type IV pilin N-terminal domain-containing protein [Nitrosopumilus adriaticus]AJW70509.1 Archaeal flagellin [Nitrosopumilus adriaticus]
MIFQEKGTRHSHRGVIGVESAIVMIAFIIVAAALAFVVLNMGFTTSQMVKTTTIAGLEESSSSMKISGTITAVGCIDSESSCFSIPRINATNIPLKISKDGNSVNFSPDVISIRYIGESIQYDNIYTGAITADTYRQSILAYRQAELETDAAFDAFNGANPVNGTLPDETSAFLYWAKRLNSNQVLDVGEHAILAIAFATNDRPYALEKINFEIIVSNGATLTVERDIPSITHEVLDLG